MQLILEFYPKAALMLHEIDPAYAFGVIAPSAARKVASQSWCWLTALFHTSFHTIFYKLLYDCLDRHNQNSFFHIQLYDVSALLDKLKRVKDISN